MALPVPALSAFDPETPVSEGWLDPLGLYAVSDELAIRIAPGVRERQSRIRYLTALAISGAVCQEFPTEAVAADGISPPWQVLEWFVVEALVRAKKGRGVPGSDKASWALRDGVPLNARRYLKTPSVFGFHGIYRTLARELKIEQAGALGEAGFGLLEVWEKEQGLRGSDWRSRLRDAVRIGLERGATYNAGVAFALMAGHLAPSEAGSCERELLRHTLLSHDTGYRREVFEFLVSTSGRAILSAAEWHERQFHDALLRSSSRSLRELIEAIQAYETVAGLLTDAWQECLFALTNSPSGLRAADLASLTTVIRAVQRLPEAYVNAHHKLSEYGLAERARRLQTLAEPVGIGEWVERLYLHHDQVQRAKPPAGKAPWVFRYDDGRYVVRPRYRLDSLVPVNGRYVFFYRTRPLNDFAGHLLGVA